MSVNYPAGDFPDYSDTTPRIQRVWGCVARTERLACIAMTAPTLIPPAFTPVEVIDAIFAANGTIDPETRRKAWEANYGMTRVEIEVDEQPINVYISNRQWCVDLWNCRQSRKCSTNQPMCYLVNFRNAPIHI